MFNEIKNKLENLGFQLSIDHEIDDDYSIVNETFNFYRKTKPADFRDYHYIINIEYPIKYPEFKISWDIAFLHNKEEYEERFWVSNIFKKNPEFINQKIIELIDKFPFCQEQKSLNFDNLEYLVAELEIITNSLNQKIFTDYRLSSRLPPKFFDYETNENSIDF